MSDTQPTEIKQLHDDLASTFEHFKKATAEQKAEITKYGEATAETKGLLETLGSRMDDIEVKMSRPGRSNDQGDAAETKAAFIEYMRKGHNAGPDVIKTLTRGDDTKGGFLAPDEMVNEIIKGAIEYTPFRDMVTVRTTGRQAVSYPKRTGTFAAVRIGEGSTRSETTGWTVGRERIPVHALHALVKVTHEDLEDTEVNLEQIINEEATEQFAVKEGTEFVSGTGVEEAEGFLVHPDLATTNLGSTTVPTYAKMVELLHALKTPYFMNATWALNLATLGVVRTITDGNDNPIWQQGLAADMPSTILGKPYRLVEEMPDISSAAKSIAVGDFKKGYVWADRISMEMQRLVEKFADEGAVGLQFRKRSGGQVVLPEAIRAGVMST